MADSIIEQHADRVVQAMTTRGWAAEKKYLHGKSIIVVVAKDQRVATIHGHSNGLEIEGVGPQQFAALLVDQNIADSVDVLFLVSCWTGATDYAQWLHTLLCKEVWAPVAAGAVTQQGTLGVLAVRDPKDPRKGFVVDLKFVGESWVSYP